MSKTKSASNLELEMMSRVRGMVQSRDQVKAEIDAIFEKAKPERKKDVQKMNSLLTQSPGAQVQTPNLQKEAAKNVLEYFEKRAYLTDAQKRFPELLKVGSTSTQRQAAPSKTLPGKAPTRSPLSGGSA